MNRPRGAEKNFVPSVTLTRSNEQLRRSRRQLHADSPVPSGTSLKLRLVGGLCRIVVVACICRFDSVGVLSVEASLRRWSYRHLRTVRRPRKVLRRGYTSMGASRFGVELPPERTACSAPRRVGSWRWLSGFDIQRFTVRSCVLLQALGSCRLP